MRSKTDARKRGCARLRAPFNADVKLRANGIMDRSLSDNCIYTIADAKGLAKAAIGGGAVSFAEKKAWVTGFSLWQAAAAAHLQMPVLFADATDCSRLLYWGLLEKIQIERDGTKYSVDRIRKLKGSHRPQELVLRSTRKTIAPGFIRPYAICVTPTFLEASAA